jgi:hypothetical protein
VKLRKLLPLLVLALSSAAAWGQGSVAWIPVTNPLGQAIARATVAVCVGNPGTPPLTGCGASSFATIYTDLTLTTPINQATTPVKTDAQGNAYIYGNSGIYWAHVYGYLITDRVFAFALPTAGTAGGGGSILSGSPGQLAVYASGGVQGDANLTDLSNVLTYTKGTFSLGGVGSGTAQILFNGNVSGTLGFGVAATTQNYNVIWPSAVALNGQTLTSDACPASVCTLSWQNPGSSGSGVGQGGLNQFPIYNSTTGIIGNPRFTENANATLVYSGTGGLQFTSSGSSGVSISASSDNSSITMGGTSKLTIQGGSQNGAAQDVRILGGPGSSTGFGSSLVLKAGSSTVNAAQSLSPGWVYVYGGSNTNSSGGAIQMAAGYGGATPYPVQIGCNGLLVTSCSNGQANITGNLQIVGKTGGFVGITVPDNVTTSITLKLPTAVATNGQALVSDNCPSFVCTLSFATVSGASGISGTLTAGKIPKAASPSVLGDSGLSDSGTVVSTAETLAAAATTAATGVSNVNSPLFQVAGNSWTGASTQDAFSFQNIAGAGTNPTQTLTLSHAGSSGTASFASSVGLTLTAGNLDASATTKSIPWTIGAGAPAGGTCTINGQVYFRTDGTLGQQLYFCNGSGTWTLQLNSGVGGASTSLSNLAAVAYNVAITPATGNLGTSNADLGSVTNPANSVYIGTAATNNVQLKAPTVTASRNATLPDNTGTIAELNLAQTWTANQTMPALISSSASPATSGFIRMALLDAIRCGVGNINCLSASATGVVNLGGTPGVAFTGPVTTTDPTIGITIQPLTASLNNNAADTTIQGGNTSGTGANGNLHLRAGAGGTGAAGLIDIGSDGFAQLVANDPTAGTTLNSLVTVNSTGNVVTAPLNSSNVIGIVRGGAGTAGSASIVFRGQALCNFDGAGTPSAGQTVTVSSAIAGDCSVTGTSGQTVGYVLSNVSGNLYNILVQIGSAPVSLANTIVTNPSASQTITPTSTTAVPLIIRQTVGAGSQNLFDVQLSNGSSAFSVSNTGVVNFGSGTAQVTSSIFQSTTSNPAAGGFIRAATSDTFNWRNNGNTGDVIFGKNNADQFTFSNTSGLVVTNAGGNPVTLSVSNPAAPRTITVGDPGGNDSLAYLAAAQSLSNKNIGGTNGLDFTLQDPATVPNPSAGNIKVFGNLTTGNLSCLTSAGANCIPGGGGGGGFTWDGTLTATGALSVTNGNNKTTLTYSTNTPSGAFTIQDTTANVSASPLLWPQTVGTSAAIPFRTTAKGTANGAELTSAGNFRVIGTGEIGLNTANAVVEEVPNEGTTGTTVNLLATVNTSGLAIKNTVAGNANVEGIVVSGAGTTGNAHIALSGIAGCKVTNGVAAIDDWIVPDVTLVDGGAVAGQCWDAGASAPTAGVQPIGRALATGAANAVVNVMIMPKTAQVFQGTANQINTSFASGVWTLSLPQSIDSGSTPTWSGVKLVGGTTIQGSISTADVGLRCGQNASTSVPCTTTISAANMTGTGNNVAGSTFITAGQSATTNATKSAGTLTIQTPQATAGAAAGPNNGAMLIEHSYVAGGTFTVANTQCFSADRTVSDCPTTATNYLGVAISTNGTAGIFAVQGSQGVTVNYDATVSPSAGWYACSSATVAGKVTAQAAACAALRQVGIIEAAGTNVTSGKIEVQFK